MDIDEAFTKRDNNSVDYEFNVKAVDRFCGISASPPRSCNEKVRDNALEHITFGEKAFEDTIAKVRMIERNFSNKTFENEQVV
jgi:hypothetical protein